MPSTAPSSPNSELFTRGPFPPPSLVPHESRTQRLSTSNELGCLSQTKGLRSLFPASKLLHIGFPQPGLALLLPQLSLAQCGGGERTQDLDCRDLCSYPIFALNNSWAEPKYISPGSTCSCSLFKTLQQCS